MRPRLLQFALTVATIGLTAESHATVRKHDANPAKSAQALALPLMFEQAPGAPDTYLTRGRGYQMWIAGNRMALHLRNTRASKTVGLEFVGGRAAQIIAEQPLAARINYLIGPRENWRTGVGAYGRVRLADIYPGIDAVFYGSERTLEYDLVVAPGVSPAAIHLAFTGADSVSADGAALAIRAGRDTIMQHPVTGYQEIDGRRVPVDVRYRIEGAAIRFEVGRYDTTRPLIMDPLLAYSTYLGATGIDRANGIAADADGNAYVVGTTDWDDMPGPIVRPHAPPTGYTPGGDDSDAYVAKFNPDGSVAWVSFIGGTKWDAGNAVAVGPDGDVYVGGDTHSSDFPTTAGAFHTAGPVSGEDEFLIRLAPDGTTFRYATTLGAEQGRFNGNLAAIAVDGSGRAYIVGATGSNTFPATVWDSRSPSLLTIDNIDAFVARFSSDGSHLDWARLFGGSYEDYATALVLDRYGSAYVVGTTCSTDFTVLNALYPSHFGPSGTGEDCSSDGFLTNVASDGSLGFSTYLGGTGSDSMTAVGQGLYDRIYVGGTTNSPPPSGVYKPSTGYSGVIYEIEPNGSVLVGTRYPGGSGDSQVNALVFEVDPNWFWVLGTTDGAGWPYGYSGYPDPPAQGHPGGGPDFFLQKFDSRLQNLEYSDTYGGSAADQATAIARNRVGDIYIAGYTRSSDFPLKNAAQTTLKSADPNDSLAVRQDGAVARFNCDIHELGPVATQPAGGGSGSTWTLVEDGCLVDPVSDVPWLHVGARVGNNTSFTVDPNPTTSERTGHIITSGRSSAAITQAAGTGNPPPPPPPSTDEIVLNAADATQITGRWQVVADALHGSILAEADQGDPKLAAPLASPANYFEFTFTADANRPYHLWVHGLAQNDSYLNDSAWVQFSDSIDSAGTPIWRTGTTDGTFVSLEPCSGCGEQGWGWRDNQYGGGLGPNVLFATSGPHTMRIQQREDGFNIGQVTLSAVKYLSDAPGADRNDSTVLQKPSGTTPPPSSTDEVVLWAATNPAVHGTWSSIADTAAAGGAALHNPDNGVPKLTAPLASPADYVDITFTADAGKPYHLWLRMKADNDLYQNDSVWVQFSGSVDGSGAPTYRIGTTNGTFVSLEECSGCGEQGWGWQNNAYGSPGELGPDIYFAQSGPQTIRIQVREDGLALDQIVLSAVKYATTPPGANKNDMTILPKTQ